MADPFLLQCFWTYPNPATEVLPGRPLNFQVVVPPPALAFPITGSIVNWGLTDASTGQPLIVGEDYQVLAGDLRSPLLSVVFAPVAGRQVSVVPALTLFYWDSTPPGSIVSVETNPIDYLQFKPKTYTLAGLNAIEQTSVIDTIKNAIRLTSQKTIIEPGDPVLLKILPRATPHVPQVITSILDETPSVEIRGAVPVKSLVEAIVGPITGALGRVVPGSKTSLEEAGDEVRRLLGEPLSIPVALDVLGKRVTKTLTPVGEPEVPVFTSTPEETNSIEGLVPIGKWQSPFEIVRVDWGVEPIDQKSADLSPGLNFLKSFLLKPKIVPLSAGSDGSPSTVTIKPTLYVGLPPNIFSTPQSFSLSVTVQLLPLALPRLAAIFKHAFNRPQDLRKGDQEAYIATDSATAPFVPSRDDCLRLLTRLTTVLNNIMAVANVLDAEWNDVLESASALSVLSDHLGRINPRYMYFVPVWSPEVETTWWKHDVVSAVVSVGAPGNTRFELWGTHVSRHLTFRGSSVIPNLNGKPFSQVVQIPAGSATAEPDDYNYNNELETIRFVTE